MATSVDYDVELTVGLDTSNIGTQLEDLKKKIEDAFKVDVDNPQLKELQKQLQENVQTAEQLKQKLGEINTDTVDGMSEGLSEAANNSQELVDAISGIDEKVQFMTTVLAAGFMDMAEGMNVIIDGMSSAANNAEELSDSGEKASNNFSKLQTFILGVAMGIDEATDGATNFFDKTLKMVQAFQKIGNGFAQVRTGVLGLADTFIGLDGKLNSFLSKFTSGFSRGRNSIDRCSFSLKNMVGTIMGVTLGVHGLWGIFNKIRGSIISSFNLALSGVPKVKAQFDALKNQIQTIKVQLASAFLPLVEIAMPIINKIIGAMSGLVSMVSQFVAALTGASTWKRAVVTGGDSAGGGKSGKSAEEKKQEQIDKAKAKADKEQERVNNRNAKALEKQAKAYKDAEKAAKGYLSPLDELNNISIDEQEIEEPELEEFDYDDYLAGLLDALDDAAAGAGGVSVQYVDEAISSGIAEAAAKVREILESLFAPLKEAWDAVGDYVMKSWKYALEQVWTLVKDIGKSFLKVWTGDTMQKVFQNVLLIIGDIGLAIGNLARQFDIAWNKNDVGTRIFENIAKLLEIITTHVHNITSGFAEWAGQLDFYPLLEGIANLLEAMQGPVDFIGGVLEDFASIVVEPFLQWVIEEGLPKLLKVFEDFMYDIDWDALRSKLQELWKSLEPFMETIGEGLIIFIDRCADAIANFANSDKFDKFIDSLIRFMDKADPEGVANAIEILVKAFIGFKLAVLGFKAIKGIDGIVSTFLNVFKNVDTIASGIKSIAGGLKDLVANSAGVKSLSTVMESFGGFGSMMTMDLGTIFGAGTAAEIGVALATGIAGSFIAAIGGFHLGKWLGATITGDEELYDSFKWLGEGGFFDSFKYFCTEMIPETLGQAKQSISDWATNAGQSFSEWDANVGQSFTEWSTNTKQNIGLWIAETGQSFEEWKVSASDKFTQWGDKISEVVSSAKNSFNEWKENAKNAIVSWYEDTVKPKFSTENWLKTYDTMKTALKTKWTETTTQWKTDIQNWWQNDVVNRLNQSKWMTTLKDIPTTFRQSFNQAKQNVINVFREISSSFSSWISSIKSGISNIFSSLTSVKNKVTGFFSSYSNSGYRINGAATGTVIPPTMQEHIVRVGDNNRDTEIISPLNTMKEAMIEALSAYGGYGGNTDNSDIVIQIDGAEVFRAVRNQSTEYKKRTGSPAFT